MGKFCRTTMPVERLQKVFMLHFQCADVGTLLPEYSIASCLGLGRHLAALGETFVKEPPDKYR